VVLQTVSGRLRLRLPERDETAELPAGHVLVLEPGVTHQVEALEGSVFLLTVARASGGRGEER
jgi:quercetin dioxygenase-like cupin family protein